MGIEIKGPVCYIVGAGEIADSRILPLRPGKEDCLIAADGGVKTVMERDMKPDIVIGDFDSLGFYPYELKPIILSCEKDDTDMLSALKQGIEKGYETFLMYGGTGGREDHTVANIQLLYYLASIGKTGFLIGKHNLLTAIKNKKIRYTGMNGYLSAFCAGDRAEGVTISGCKYNLDNGELTNLYPIGVSNEFTDMPAEISVKNGMLLIVTENPDVKIQY